MKKVKNMLVVENFVNCREIVSNHSESLYINGGDKLINYNTTIAQFINGILYVNVTKYSSTTSKLQNMVKREAFHYVEVENVPMGCYDLTKYVKELA